MGRRAGKCSWSRQVLTCLTSRGKKKRTKEALEEEDKEDKSRIGMS
jgi:hypothetical protein